MCFFYGAINYNMSNLKRSGMKIKTLSFLFLLGMIIVSVISSCKKDEDDNNNPTITAVVVNPATIGANGIVSIAVTASDPDGDALNYPDGYALIYSDGMCCSLNASRVDAWLRIPILL